ncbi:MAG: PilX N-terminal domain-containing pilus assembly protein [Gammaproteobacteria bacterium]
MNKIVITKQSGAVLFVGLIMLLVMSLIAVTSMQNSTLEVRMAGNTRDSLVALQTAEAALQAGEEFLDAGGLSLADFDNDGSDALYDNSNDELWKTINWQDTNSKRYMTFSPSNVATEPRYVIQHISETQVAPKLLVENYGEGQAGQTIQLFRVTARGTGGSDNTKVYLQSIYGVDF